jgi:hypothetical protein
MRLPVIARVTAAIVLSASAAGAQLQNGSFESPSVAGGHALPGGTDYDYLLGLQNSWLYTLGTGLINTAGGPTAFNSPPATDGVQVAFLQGTGATISQVVTGLTAGGSYTLTFDVAGRFNSGCCDGNTNYEVLFGGLLIGSGSTTSFQPFTPQSYTFTSLLSVGALAFVNTSGLGDHTFFIDDVTLTADASTTAPEPATFALLGGGLLGLVGVARRRRQS